MIDLNLLQKYLLSKDSIFEVDSLQDFLETLHILGFQRGSLLEKQDDFLGYRFVNPNFQPSDQVPGDFFKLPKNPTSSAFNDTVPIIKNHSVNLLQRLLTKKCRTTKITKLEFARLRLSFELQKRLEESRQECHVIDYDIDEPDYTKNNEIAGYYGCVQLDALKEGFQEYFPIYDEADNLSTIKEQLMEVEGDFIVLEEEVETVEVKSENLSEAVSVDIEQEIPQYDQPPKKKRNVTRKAREANQETAQALFFLHKKEMRNVKKTANEE